ncbi:MAG: hypothetical protein VKK43_02805 [Synechococcaceae cyanobacterium]|nr:hypothetical protein [Synechococcaceae cyanobacterium]
MNLPSFSSFFRPIPLAKALGAGVGALSVLGLGGLPGQAIGVVLDFEGIGNEVPIVNYYPGTSFSDNALAVEAFSAGGSGDFTNEPTPTAGMMWLDGSAIAATYASGFRSFSTFYSSVNASGELGFFDGPDATGTLIATRALTPLGQDCPATEDPGATFRCWAEVSVTLPSDATSVRFTAPANQMVFDNVGFNNVPVPGPLPVVGAAAAFGVSRRLRQRVRGAVSSAQLG